MSMVDFYTSNISYFAKALVGMHCKQNVTPDIVFGNILRRIERINFREGH